jgi:hypothetical protein
MKKVIILLAALVFAAPAFGAAGIDAAANHFCPGVVGALSDGGPLDCVVLANTGGFAEVFTTFKAAEAIPDLSNLDGQVDVAIIGSWGTTGQFWDTSAGACLDANGAAPAANTFIGGKPSANCGNVATIRPAFSASAQTTVINNTNSLSMFFTVYTASPIAITTVQRIFGFQIRYDPIYATENGFFTCGACATPVCWTVIKAQPGSLSALPTTTLTTSTGEAVGCGLQAWYNGGCPAVPTKAKTWGQLKSLYR